jgi:iron complex outermembrane receptor protein
MIDEALASDILTTCVRKMNASGPVATAGGTSNQMTYLRENGTPEVYERRAGAATSSTAKLTLAMSLRESTIAFLLIAPLFASAQTSPAPQPPRAIGEVTLFGEEQLKIEAATKTEIPISKAPSAVTVVTAKQIAESGARTVPDLLRLVAGVNVRWNPMVPTIDIRGFGENPFSNRVLLLIDGAPYNSGDTGGLPLSPAFDIFPVQNIKRIEVVRGPGSSLYGENAYWGVINIVTLSGDDLSGGDVQVYGGSRTTGEVSAQYGQKFSRGSIIGGVRMLRSMFPQEFWMDDRSTFRASDVFLKGTAGDWQVSGYRHDDRLDGFAEEFPSGLGLPPTAGFRSAHTLKQTLDAVALRYNHAPQNGAVTYSADVSWAHRYGMHCAGCHAAQERPEFSSPADHGYQAIADFRVGLHMIPGHDILGGVEARRLDRAEHKVELSDDAGAASGYDKVAVYAQDQFDIISNVLRAVAGIRYDGKTKLFDAKTSPRLSLVYTPVEKLVLRGGYSTAFRFPTFSELYQSSWFLTTSTEIGIPPFPLSLFAPNPNLKPEEISTWELGGEYQISPTLSAKTDLYRSRVRNFIVIVQHFAPLPNPSTLGWENQPAAARVSGAELELRANLMQRVTGFVNWAHQTESQMGGGVDSSGTPFEFVYAPSNKVNFGAYGGPFGGVRGALEVSWRGSYTAPHDWAAIRSGFTDFSSPTLPSYALVNGRVSYDIPNTRLRATLFGNNLLNKRPEETIIGAENRLAGREFFGQVEMRF